MAELSRERILQRLLGLEEGKACLEFGAGRQGPPEPPEERCSKERRGWKMRERKREEEGTGIKH